MSDQPRWEPTPDDVVKVIDWATSAAFAVRTDEEGNDIAGELVQITEITLTGAGGRFVSALLLADDADNLARAILDSGEKGRAWQEQT